MTTDHCGGDSGWNGWVHTIYINGDYGKICGNLPRKGGEIKMKPLYWAGMIAGSAMFLAACSQTPGTIKQTVKEVAPTVAQQIQPTIAAKVNEVIETVAPTAANLINKVPTVKAALTPKTTPTPTPKVTVRPTASY